MIFDYVEIGNNIRYYRTKKRLKQHQLADIVSTSSAHISHIECARTKLSTELFVQIAEALSVSIYSLLGSNIASPVSGAFDAELAAILKDTSPMQRKLCLELCRTVMNCGGEIE